MEFIDLKAQYQILKLQIDEGIRRVLEHGQYIPGIRRIRQGGESLRTSHPNAAEFACRLQQSWRHVQITKQAGRSGAEDRRCRS